MQNKVDEFLVFLFTQELDERLSGESFARFVCCQPILGKDIVKVFDNCIPRFQGG